MGLPHRGPGGGTPNPSYNFPAPSDGSPEAMGLINFWAPNDQCGSCMGEGPHGGGYGGPSSIQGVLKGEDPPRGVWGGDSKKNRKKIARIDGVPPHPSQPGPGHRIKGFP